ncbi:heme lyase NrfEFG subunit NrfF [Vibrio sinaloensis]|uniref:heme lyase NrfEFG subunit NrfF n=1 Tax=Photobacterium sp. (strain ATCC 43367) TaxID=379097 RepID=UPI0035F0DEC9
MRNLLFLICLLTCSVAAQESQLFAPADNRVAVEVELFEFSTLEKQKTAIELAKSLRCPQCQNQNLVESNSPLAKDLRLIVFEMINDGKDEQQVVSFMTQRYGEFVLYKPRFSWQNGLLWGLPVLLLVAFLLLSFKSISRRQG